MSAVYALLLTVASAVLIFGLLFKIIQYTRVPAPLKIPVTPAPLSTGGVALRLAKEAILFAALFRSNKWTWLFGWMFHMSLFIVIANHLRFFIKDVPLPLVLLQNVGEYAAFTMFIGLTGLLVRRIYVARIKYISSPSDYLWLILLMFIGFSGMMMRFVSHTDIIAVKQFCLGLVSMN